MPSKRIVAHLAKGSAEAYAWADRMRKLREGRAKSIRSLGKKREKEFFGAERNPAKKIRRPRPIDSICAPAQKKSYRKNPIALFGNPPREINSRVAGVLYNEVIEIRARKTQYRKGFYKHPFEHTVQLLALDNGDLLLRSTEGKELWEQD